MQESVMQKVQEWCQILETFRFTCQVWSQPVFHMILPSNISWEKESILKPNVWTKWFLCIFNKWLFTG